MRIEKNGITESKSVAVIMACHNRKTKTLNCIQTVNNFFPREWKIAFYITDDGSSDGTSEALRELELNLKIIQGTGDLYWAQSMATAEASISEVYDGLIWLNDDVLLDVTKFEIFLQNINALPNSILVGQFRGEKSNGVTYGGYWRSGKSALNLTRIFSQTEPLLIDTFNGNFVWVPWSAKLKLSRITGDYGHSYADLDYGYRANKLKISAHLIPGYLGICESNSRKKAPTNFREILEIFDAKGLPIWSQWKFHQLYSGWAAPVFAISPYIKAFISFGISKVTK